MLHPQKQNKKTEVNGESSLFFILRGKTTKTTQYYYTAPKVFPNVLIYYWLQKLVELRPSKKLGQMSHGILGTRGNQYPTVYNGENYNNNFDFRNEIIPQILKMKQ